MQNSIQLNAEEIGLIELALQETITVLKNRFEEKFEFVHPAKKYEELYDKLTDYTDQIITSRYSLSPVENNIDKS